MWLGRGPWFAKTWKGEEPETLGLRNGHRSQEIK